MADSIDEKTLVQYHLHRLLSRPEPGRALDVIHASDVIDDDKWWCPRRQALMLARGMKPPDERRATAESVVYQYSSDVAARVISWLSRLGLAIGDWACMACDHVHTFGQRPERCELCGSERFRYKEVRFVSQDSGISGGIDVFVRLPGVERIRMMEIKAPQKEDFVALSMPLGKHRLRTNLYLRLIAESDHPLKEYIDTQQGIVAYVSKGGYGAKTDAPARWGLSDKSWSPFKEYLVPRDDSATQRFGDHARPLRDWIRSRGQTPLPARICDTSSCKRAAACEVRVPCFEIAS